jgi:hypothetical protein
MNRFVTVHFDGMVMVLDKPVKLPIGKPLRIQAELAPKVNGKKNGKEQKIKIIGAGQFHSGVPDLATNKKYVEGGARIGHLRC